MKKLVVDSGKKNVTQKSNTKGKKVKKGGTKKKKGVRSGSLPKDVKRDVDARMLHLFGAEVPKFTSLPHIKAEEPCLISSKEGGEIMVINSPLVGALTSEKGRNIFRNALRLAEKLNCAGVIITGNLMYSISQRYGTNRPFKTQVSGITVDCDKIEKSYPVAVVSDPKFQRTKDRLERGKPVYVPLWLRLEHNLEMLAKVFVGENGKSLYSGHIFVTFGKLEEELIRFYANELQRIDLFGSRAWAQKRVSEYTAKWRKAKGKEKNLLLEKIRGFKEWLALFVRMANNADQAVNMTRDIVAGYFVKKYEQCIPNSKVVSVGDAFFKIGSHTMMVTTEKMKNDYKGSLSTSLASATLSFSKGRSSSTIPSLMLGTGMNPFLDAKMVPYQGSEEEGDKRACFVVQLPMCIDSERYREVIRDQNILKDIITRSASVGGFESGIVTFRWCGLSLPVMSSWTSEVLKNRSIFASDKTLNALIGGENVEHKCVYIHKEGCTHYGAVEVLQYESPNDPDGRFWKYHHQAQFEFLLRNNAPIHCYAHDGDHTQGMNHPYTKNPHLDRLLPEDLVVEMKKISELNISDAEKFKRVRILSQRQSVLSGIYDFEQQSEGYAKSLEPYVEYFVKILERVENARLSFRGALAPIIEGAGNHCQNSFKTVTAYVSDAKLILDKLKISLMLHLNRTSRNHLIHLVEKGLLSPRNGPISEGRGAILVENIRRFAMVMKHKQGRMDKTRIRASRRSVNEIEFGLPVLNLSGDNHKFGICVTRGTVHVKTGAQLGEGTFGREIDFTEQDICSVIVGIPVGGTSNGPIEFVILDQESMKKFAKNPFSVESKNMFRNAL